MNLFSKVGRGIGGFFDQQALGGLLDMDPELVTPQLKKAARGNYMNNIGMALQAGAPIGMGMQQHQGQLAQLVQYLQQQKLMEAQQRKLRDITQRGAQLFTPGPEVGANGTLQAPAPQTQQFTAPGASMDIPGIMPAARGQGPTMETLQAPDISMSVTPPQAPDTRLEASGQTAPERSPDRLRALGIEALAIGGKDMAEPFFKMATEMENAKKRTFSSAGSDIYDTSTGQVVHSQAAKPEKPEKKTPMDQAFDALVAGGMTPDAAYARLQEASRATPTPAKQTPADQIFAGYLQAAGGDPVKARRMELSDEAAARGRERAASGELSTQQLNQTNILARQFDNTPIVKGYNETAAKFKTVKDILSKPGLGGPGDLAVVYEFMKGLDPTSVVRESEYETAAKSGNVFAGSLARFNGYLKPEGGFLPPQVKQAFADIVGAKLKNQNTQVKRLMNDYGRRIEIITKQPSSGTQWLTDYTQLLPIEDAPQQQQQQQKPRVWNPAKGKFE